MLRMLSSEKRIRPPFRRYWRIVSIFGAGVFSACLLNACGSFFDDRSEMKAARLNESSLSCVKDVPESFSLWAQGYDASLSDSIDCAASAFDKFLERVRGEEKQGWKAEDIASFVAGEFSATPESVHEKVSAVLILKRVLLGGDERRLSREELIRARDLILRLKPSLVELTSSMPFLTLKAEDGSHEMSDLAARRFRSFIREIEDELRRTEALENGIARKRHVQLVDLAKALSALGIQGDVLMAWLPMIQSAKAILAGGEPTHVERSRWQRVVSSASNLWSLYVRYHYSLRDSEDLLGTDLEILANLARAGLDEAGSALRSQGSEQSISPKHLESLIEAMGERDLLPLGLKAATVRGLLPVALGKFLYGNSKADRHKKSQSFGWVQLQVLKDAVEDWVEGQRSLLRAYSLRSDTNSGFASFARIWRDAVVTDNSSFSPRGRFRSELALLLARSQSFVTDDEGRPLIARSKTATPLKRSDVDRLNFARVVAGLIIRGYPYDVKAAESGDGLNETEVEEFGLDLRDLGIDLGINDVRTLKAGTRTYMEASLFTTLARGGERIGLHQAIEWFFIAYGAQKTSSKYYEALVSKCGNDQYDAVGREKLNVACFRAALKEDFEQVFSNLPQFVAWVRGQRENDKEFVGKLILAVENAARSTGAVDAPLEPAEALAMFPVVHYAENLVRVHDRNGNGILDDTEVRKYFPIIRPYIKKLAAGKADEEWVQKAIFHYVLKNGSLPSQSLMGKWSVAWASFSEKIASQEATRFDVLRIIGGIASFGRQERHRKIAEYFSANETTLEKSFETGEPEVIKQLTDLFQCQPQAAPAFADLVKRNAKEILAPVAGNFSTYLPPDLFTTRIKDLLANDSRFVPLCLPF